MGRYRLVVTGGVLLFGFSAASAIWAEDIVSDWEDILTGTKLELQSHVSAGAAAGSGVRSTWDLCRDGTFHSSHSSTASVEIPGSKSLSTNQVSHAGKWRVEGQGQNALLILTYREGQGITYQLTSDSQTIYLQGDRVSHTKSLVC